MGGFFGIASRDECVLDVFFGTDYHSHLGTKTGGMAAWDKDAGMQRQIHNISNSPFRTKFENITDSMKGTSVIGCISDTDPQPLLIRSKLGVFSICIVGRINNIESLAQMTFEAQGHFNAVTEGKINQTELVASMISMKDDFVEGIKFAQEMIEGTCSIIILRDDGSIIAARDKVGRLPILIGEAEDGYGVSFESYALEKMGFKIVKNLGPAEIVELTHDKMTVLAEPGKEMKICSFLWSYYGYPTTTYEGVNVEVMRYRNGHIMARDDINNGFDIDSIDYVGGVPDSGTPHAIGYSNEAHRPFARAFIKYTPTWSRSFMPTNQKERNKVAKMKQIPVVELIKDKNLLFVDDSIVRGTQLRETVEFLYNNGAKAVHMRSACPPIMYGCPFVNFSSSKNEMELITRRTIIELEGEEGLNHIEEYSDGKTERGKAMRKAICDKFKFDSLEFQSLEGIYEAIGLDPEQMCTYCWNGKK